MRRASKSSPLSVLGNPNGNSLVGTVALRLRPLVEGAVKRRIMDMGITRGTEVHIRKVAPLGDPVEITVRGFELSLR